MKFVVTIRDNQTGDVQNYEDPSDYEDLGHFEYMWLEHSYSCDCNRGLFFARAAGKTNAETKDYPCGDARFTVLSAISDDGTTAQVDN